MRGLGSGLRAAASKAATSGVDVVAVDALRTNQPNASNLSAQRLEVEHWRGRAVGLHGC